MRTYKRKRGRQWSDRDKRMNRAEQLRGEGLSLREIGAELNISAATVMRDLRRRDETALVGWSDGARTAERALAELPGRAEFGGYVYVIEFATSMIKVGRTKDAQSRMASHRKDALTFGTSVARWWVSPLHSGWVENEEALKGLAHELGGIPVSPEYFNDVSFDDLLAEAQALPFPAVDMAEALRVRAAARRRPAWLDGELEQCSLLIRYGDITDREAVEDATDRIVRSEPAFARSLVERFVWECLAAQQVAPRLAGSPA